MGDSRLRALVAKALQDQPKPKKRPTPESESLAAASVVHQAASAAAAASEAPLTSEGAEASGKPPAAKQRTMSNGDSNRASLGSEGAVSAPTTKAIWPNGGKK